MGALPKRKVSRHRRGNRRRHQYLTAPQLTKCPNCGEYNLSHRACKSCGQYKSRQVIDVGGDDEE
jgi:large subunit ribosomal protein L32